MDYWSDIAREKLSPEYFTEMRDFLRKGYFTGHSEEWFASENGETHLKLQIYERMLDTETYVLPWVDAALPLKGKRVLEIGCGTGSTTAAIAPWVDDVQAWEILPIAIETAKVRTRLLGRENVHFRLVEPDWIESATTMLAEAEFDFIYLHAVIEHLKIEERISLLRAIWRALPSGGAFCVYETPNRLNMFDWHSSWRPFMDWLPTDLACLYYGDGRQDFLSSKLAFAIDDVSKFTPEVEEKLYRHGRGASFHEFDLAIGLKNMNIIADCTTIIERGVWQKDPRYTELLREMIEKHHPEVPIAFTSPSLDIVVQKP